MKKVYKRLTEEQKSRGVIFSSTLSKYRTETKEDNIHEVLATEEEKTQNEKIARLLNDKFFDGSDWRFNIIRR